MWCMVWYKEMLVVFFIIAGIYIGYVMMRCTFNETGCVEHKTDYLFTWYTLENPFDFGF